MSCGGGGFQIFEPIFLLFVIVVVVYLFCLLACWFVLLYFN